MTQNRYVCSNCGKRHPKIVFHDGRWFCPGVCDVTRKRIKKPEPTLADVAGPRPRLMPLTTPDYMAPAWAGCLHWAIGCDEIREAFFEQTGCRWSPPRNGLDRMIDEATGADRAFIEKFVGWFNENVWGDMDHDAEEEILDGLLRESP